MSSINSIHMPATYETMHQCTVSHIIVTSPQVSWLFFKARAKRPYLDSYGSSEQRGKTANWPRPGGLR